MGTISSLNFEDIRTPKLFFENVMGIKYNSSLQATNCGPMSPVSDTKGRLAKFYDLNSAQRAKLGSANSISTNVVTFESLMQQMYYCILSIRDKKDKEIFESWEKFDMVLGKFIRGINKLISLLSQAGTNEAKINSILENVVVESGDKKGKVLQYLNNLKSQIEKWQREVPESNISTKNPTIQIKIPKLKPRKTTKKPLDTDKSSSEEKLSSRSARSESEVGRDIGRQCNAPGYEGYYYLTSDHDTCFVADPGVTIDTPRGVGDYVFFVSEYCTNDRQKFSFSRKLKHSTPLKDCLKQIAAELFKYNEKLSKKFNDADQLATYLTGDLGADGWIVTRCSGAASAGGVSKVQDTVYFASLATDRKTLLPFFIDTAGMDE